MKNEKIKPRYVGRKWKLLDHHVSHLDPISLTIPDESMSLQEILRKHTSGMNTVETNFREGQFTDYEGLNFDSPDLEKLRDMDIHDRENYIRLLQQERAEREEKILTAVRKSQAAKDKAVLKEQGEEAKLPRVKSDEAKPDRKEGGTTDAAKANPKK